jgi:hypothetical protein
MESKAKFLGYPVHPIDRVPARAIGHRGNLRCYLSLDQHEETRRRERENEHSDLRLIEGSKK